MLLVPKLFVASLLYTHNDRVKCEHMQSDSTALAEASKLALTIFHLPTRESIGALLEGFFGISKRLRAAAYHFALNLVCYESVKLAGWPYLAAESYSGLSSDDVTDKGKQFVSPGNGFRKQLFSLLEKYYRCCHIVLYYFCTCVAQKTVMLIKILVPLALGCATNCAIGETLHVRYKQDFIRMTWKI